MTGAFLPGWPFRLARGLRAIRREDAGTGSPCSAVAAGTRAGQAVTQPLVLMLRKWEAPTVAYVYGWPTA